MVPTFGLDPLSAPDPANLVTDGVLKIDDGGVVVRIGVVWVVWVVGVVELRRETVDGTLGIASGSLPAAFARTGSNQPPSCNNRSADSESDGLFVPYNSDTPNGAPQRQAVYRRGT